MKALVLHGPGRYGVEADWPTPEPRPGWARVRVRYAGICGSDLPRFATTGSYHHPMILGHEFAGTVDAPAPGSSRFRPGDPVAVLPLIPCGDCPGCRLGEPFHCARYQFLGSRNDGGFAEFCLVPEENLFALPPGLELRTGAFIEPIAVALHVLRRAGFQPEGTALVFGAGAIGLLVALWLRIFGAARVAVADVRNESLELARRLGFSDAFDPSGQMPEGLPQSFDAVFEAAGSGKALLAAVERTRDKGCLTVVGRDTADTHLPLAVFERFMRKEISLHGCWGYNLGGEEGFVYESLARGAFPLQPLITHEVGLEDAPRLIAGMVRREFYYCKVMLRM
jgi:threonine dehydrogenase-like Zn-dependent dehydrogenase